MIDAQTVYRHLLACEYPALPDALKPQCVSRPLWSIPVRSVHTGFEVTDTALLPVRDGRSLVPKLGIKGWRDIGVLGTI